MAATETATYAVELRDETSDATGSAVAGLERLKSRIDAGQKALGEMQRAMRNLKAATTPNLAQIKDLKERIDAQKQAIAAAQARYLQLGGTFGKTTQAAQGTASGLEKLLASAQGVPGPVGAIASQFSSLLGMLGRGGPVVMGLAAVASGLLAIVAASAAATAALLRYGVAQADARRAELLRLEGLVRIRSIYGLAAGSATELQSAIDRVTDSIALGRAQVSDYAQSLYRMGLRGRELQEALDGMAIAGSAGGDRLARRFAGMAAAAVRTGGSVRRLTDDFRARFGAIADRQALSLDRQMVRLRENVEGLFGDLRVEGFLSSLRQVTSLFSQSTATGRALKTIVEALFNPILDGAGRAGPVVRRFFQGMVIGALVLTIAILRARNALRDAFGGSSFLSGAAAQRLAIWAGVAAFTAIAAVILTSVAALGAFIALAGVVAAGVMVFVAPLLVAGVAFGALIAAGARAVDWLRGQNWSELGSSLVQGLSTGILDGGQRVLDSVRSVASRATQALRDALQIRSPSRVFAALGVQIPRGLAAGVEAAAPVAASAVDDVVRVPDAGSYRSAAPGASAQTTSSTSIGPFYIEVRGNGSAEQAEDFASQLARVLEGLAIQRGAPA